MFIYILKFLEDLIIDINDSLFEKNIAFRDVGAIFI
jgi:hypothetical protein